MNTYRSMHPTVYSTQEQCASIPGILPALGVSAEQSVAVVDELWAVATCRDWRKLASHDAHAQVLHAASLDRHPAHTAYHRLVVQGSTKHGTCH